MAMADLEHFSLRWNNFHSNLSSGFQALLQEEDLVDVTLAASGEFVQAHKIILSVCSPYFKQLFKVNPCKHPIVILKDVHHKDLVDILQFMYQGEVNVRQEDLGAFLKTAELLQIKGLTGQDSLKEHEHDNVPVTPKESSTPRPRPPRRRIEKPATSRVEKQVSSPAQPPFKRMRSEAPTSRSPVVLSDDPPAGEYGDMRCPKQEPVDFEPETETLPSVESHMKEDTMEHILGGESSHSHHDSMQGMSSEQLDLSSMQDVSAAGLLHQTLTTDSSPAGTMPTAPGASTDTNTSQDGEQGGPRYVESRKGKLQLVVDGYIYNLINPREKRQYWRCTEYSKKGCRGHCIMQGERVISQSKPHNHEPLHERIRTKEEWARIKQQFRMERPWYPQP